MIYGYIRVSTDHQTTLNQEFEITRFCRGKSMEISGWIRETISGTQAYDKRALGKLLAFAFGLSAEIERRLISARTREALARRKAEGKRVGRPEGSKSKVRLLDEWKEEILAWLAQGESKAAIARRLGVSRGTFYQWEKGGVFK